MQVSTAKSPSSITFSSAAVYRGRPYARARILYYTLGPIRSPKSENGPVIIEYKRSQTVNLVNHALAYLSWLLEHKEQFHDLLVTKLAGEGLGKTDRKRVHYG